MKEGKQRQEAVGETRAYNDALTLTADKWDIIAGKVNSAGRGMADAFGEAGRAIGDVASIYADYHASRERAEVEHAAKIRDAGNSQVMIAQENERFALRSSGVQVEAFGDMAAAAKGFFKDGSSGYKALAAAEKVYRVAQLAMSLQSMVQNTLETTTTVANAGVRATAEGTAGIAAQSKLPFPFNIAAMAATGAALVAAGVMVFGGTGAGNNSLPKPNAGTGTVLGDPDAKSESIRRGIDALADIDTVMLGHSREMAASLKSIDSQIGGFASLVLRTGSVNASGGVDEGFKANAIGSALGSIPLVGGILKGLFGTKTKVVGSGLYGDAQTLDEILNAGFDASYYSDVQKKKKLFGITTSTKYRTSFSDADSGLENQFTLILREFNSAILAAAGPLGESTDAIEQKLNGFVVDIGKIDLQGLTGEEIQEKLSAVFGGAADKMATTAFPGMERFQKVGEGLFETLVRVSSTVESVTSSLDLLGSSGTALGVDSKMGLAGRFESVGAFTSAIDGYFDAFYSEQEKAAARTAQMAKALESLGLSMPGSIAAFRSLVEAQDLTSSSGQATYATLLQIAPAFADLQSALGNTGAAARNAADILAERQDIERKILELQGNTAALRDLDIAKIDESNRVLQQRYWGLVDEKDALAEVTRQQTEREGLERQYLELQGDTNALRALDLAKLAEGNRALQERNWALAEEKERLAEVARQQTEREGLERQLLQLQGNTSALRDLDLAKLFEGNRALQERIWALDAEKAANDTATAALKARNDALGGIAQRIAAAQGNTDLVKQIERERELAGAVDETVRTELRRLHAIEDATEKQSKLTSAYEQQAAMIAAVTDKAYESARALRAYAEQILVDELLSPGPALVGLDQLLLLLGAHARVCANNRLGLVLGEGDGACFVALPNEVEFNAQTGDVIIGAANGDRSLRIGKLLGLVLDDLTHPGGALRGELSEPLFRLPDGLEYGRFRAEALGRQRGNLPPALRGLLHLFERTKQRLFDDSLGRAGLFNRPLEPGGLSLKDARMIFVGLDAYSAAGGRTEAEMFMGTDGEERATDIKLLDKLAREKAEPLVAPQAKRDGFKEGLLAPGVGNGARWPKAPAGMDRHYPYYESKAPTKAYLKKCVAVYAIAHDGIGIQKLGYYQPTPVREPHQERDWEAERLARAREAAIESRAARMAVYDLGKFTGTPLDGHAFWPAYQPRLVDEDPNDADFAFVAVQIRVPRASIEGHRTEAERLIDEEAEAVRREKLIAELKAEREAAQHETAGEQKTQSEESV